MKTWNIISVITSSLIIVSAQNVCKLPAAQIPTEWRTMEDSCTEKMKKQIPIELGAAMTYMAMGAHFSRDTINRPGFAKMFFEAASEERGHAIKLIEYLLMRGDVFANLQSIIQEVPKPLNTTWTDGLDALNQALKLEAKVTNDINEIIKECEGSRKKNKLNDYHLVDYLTNEFLQEQYTGQRDLAGKASTLGKMIKNHGVLGEFLFDKKLLSGETLFH
ncbi:ferritin heavy chain-like [Rhodnius prolixus]|uniref:Ferritin n=1 Tax=Rhodnius prolixus TaxID=13249 RepID=T1HYY6_RHOPR